MVIVQWLRVELRGTRFAPSCSMKALRLTRVDAEAIPLEQAPEVYARLRRGEIRGRAVIVPER
jgi:D-arabinose 1-dehydrogenase-like Zn-dependent alcohol dehydrogenase